MHTQIKSIIIFPCSILSDDDSYTYTFKKVELHDACTHAMHANNCVTLYMIGNYSTTVVITFFSCTILSSDSSVAQFCLRCVSEPTASFRNPFISLIPSCPVSVSSFPCSPIDRPRPDTLASALISL